MVRRLAGSRHWSNFFFSFAAVRSVLTGPASQWLLLLSFGAVSVSHGNPHQSSGDNCPVVMWQKCSPAFSPWILHDDCFPCSLALSHGCAQVYETAGSICCPVPHGLAGRRSAFVCSWDTDKYLLRPDRLTPFSVAACACAGAETLFLFARRCWAWKSTRSRSPPRCSRGCPPP